MFPEAGWAMKALNSFPLSTTYSSSSASSNVITSANETGSVFDGVGAGEMVVLPVVKSI